MKNLLLLVQSQSDVDALPAAAEAIKRHGYDGLWLLFSPAVLVDSKAASAEHDANIAGLRAAMKKCADTEDFEGAKGYKGQLDAALLDKTVKVKEAWKSLTDAQKEAETARVFDAFFAAKPAPNVRPQMLQDHYEPAQFIAMLNSIKAAWFAPFVPGTFAMDWAANMVGVSAVPPISLPVTVKENLSAPTPPKTAAPVNPRKTQLMRMTIDQLGQEALTLKFVPSGNRMKIVHDILKREAEAAAK